MAVFLVPHELRSWCVIAKPSLSQSYLYAHEPPRAGPVATRRSLVLSCALCDQQGLKLSNSELPRCLMLCSAALQLTVRSFYILAREAGLITHGCLMHAHCHLGSRLQARCKLVPNTLLSCNASHAPICSKNEQ